MPTNFGDLEKAKEVCDSYVNNRDIINGGEMEYNIIQCNQTMNESYKTLPDNHYMICSGSYLNQLISYWKERDKTITVNVHHTAKVPKA